MQPVAAPGDHGAPAGLLNPDAAPFLPAQAAPAAAAPAEARPRKLVQARRAPAKAEPVAPERLPGERELLRGRDADGAIAALSSGVVDAGYRAMLAALLYGGTPFGPADVAELGRWRRLNGYTEESHSRVRARGAAQSTAKRCLRSTFYASVCARRFSRSSA